MNMRTTLFTYDGKQVEYSPKKADIEQGGAIPCLQCGVCCTRCQPQINAEEASIIAQSLDISLEDFYRDYIDKKAQMAICLLRQSNSGCVFLQYEGEKALCTIHPFKPEACRRWIPSLSRSECRDGLKKQRSSNHLLLLPGEIYISKEELSAFYYSLESQAA